MNIVIRADASVYIGSGHIMRCLVLGQSLVLKGHSVSFACRPQSGDLVKFLGEKGFHVYELTQPKKWLKPKDSADYEAWLQVPWLDDATSFVEQVYDADLLIIDHYALNKEWQRVVKGQLNCKVFVIDDLVREHDADFILDQTLRRTSHEYQVNNPSAKILAGCNFALLNPLFSQFREKALEFSLWPKQHKVLISMGGIDLPNATFSVLEAFSLHPEPKPQITVLLGPKAPHYDQVKMFCLANTGWIKHFDFVDNMAELMLDHSVAIGAPGSTSWERACLGIPSIIVPLAENQNTISQNMVKANAVIKVELNRISFDLLVAYKYLIANWTEFRHRNLALCDGLGVQRVSYYIDLQMNANVGMLNVRTATIADIEKVFEWQCQAETRKYFLNPELPSWEEHKSWMSKKLKNNQDYFYILELLDTKEQVGVVRLDRKKSGEYLVSIFVAPRYYGKGIAKQALAYIDSIHTDVILHATVLEGNIPSQKLFIAARYLRVSSDTFIRHPIF